MDAKQERKGESMFLAFRHLARWSKREGSVYISDMTRQRTDRGLDIKWRYDLEGLLHTWKLLVVTEIKRRRPNDDKKVQWHKRDLTGVLETGKKAMDRWMF